MVSYLGYYLLFGLLFNLIVDILADYFESENRLSFVEKVFVCFLWPWAAYKLVYEFLKAK